jgi:hypothetical protein
MVGWEGAIGAYLNSVVDDLLAWLHVSKVEMEGVVGQTYRQRVRRSASAREGP